MGMGANNVRRREEIADYGGSKPPPYREAGLLLTMWLFANIVGRGFTPAVQHNAVFANIAAIRFFLGSLCGGRSRASG